MNLPHDKFYQAAIASVIPDLNELGSGFGVLHFPLESLLLLVWSSKIRSGLWPAS